MTPLPISRRTLVQRGGAALAGLSVLRLAGPTYAFQTPVTGEVIPWLDQPEPNPEPEAIVRQLTVFQNPSGSGMIAGHEHLIPGS